MKKIEKLFDSYKGLVIFYIIVAVLALMIAKKIDRINISTSQNTEETRSYYA